MHFILGQDEDPRDDEAVREIAEVDGVVAAFGMYGTANRKPSAFRIDRRLPNERIRSADCAA